MALHGEKIAVLGDLHGKWNQRDNDYFDRAGYDLLVFVGDLGGGTAASERETVRSIRSLRTPALVMPGNNDAPFLDLLYGEVDGPPDDRFDSGKILKSIACGYSTHLVETEFGDLTIVAGRPCAMGGSEFSFGRQIEHRYGVTGLEHSAGRLKRLVDDCSTESVVFLAHNGPFGLGGTEKSPWARDFRLPDEMEDAYPKDWGDRDLTEAIEYARAKGKNVLAVIAGHMHRSARGGQRPLVTHHEGSCHINAAVVPRIVAGEEGERHHFTELVLRPDATGLPKIHVREVWAELSDAPSVAVASTVSLSN